MYFVVSEKDVTTHALISVFRIFLRMTRVHVFLSMLEVTLSGAFRHDDVDEDSRGFKNPSAHGNDGILSCATSWCSKLEDFNSGG